MVENEDRQDVSEAESRNQIRAKLSQVCDIFRITDILVSFEDIKLGNVNSPKGYIGGIATNVH